MAAPCRQTGSELACAQDSRRVTDPQTLIQETIEDIGYEVSPVSVVRKDSMPAAGWKKMSEEEIRLARAWYNDDKEVPSEIAERLGRDKSVITRLLVKKVVRQKQGPPTLLTDAQVDFMVKRLDELVRKANCKYHVTADMLKRSTRLKVTVRAMQTASRKRNIYFRKLREKPCLTEQDIADRYAFAKKYRSRTKAWWKKTIHAFIDGKHFKVYLNKTQRERAAQHATFGAYRAP
ncbi:unnamed protein product, partial [Polarella glacialis]